MIDRVSFLAQENRPERRPARIVARVADGPVNGTGWYVLDNAPRAVVAPGGVVLCHDRTLLVHTDAQRHAKTAWTLLRHWEASKPNAARRREHSGSGGAV